MGFMGVITVTSGGCTIKFGSKEKKGFKSHMTLVYLLS